MAGTINYANGFLLTARSFVDTQLSGRIIATKAALANDWPDLPAEEDEVFILPPVGRAHARRVRGTALQIVYNLTDTGVFLIAIVPV